MIIKNRAGRIVNVPDDLGKHLIKNDGAVLYEPEMNKGFPEEESEQKNPLECPYCGKVCASQLGYNKHTTACKKKANSSQ